MRAAWAWGASVLLAGTSLAAEGGPWAIPAPGSCTEPAGPGADPEDARPRPRPGDVITHEQTSRLRELVPPEIWEHRERFFYSGMRLEIGPCYRDYSPPAFFREATEQLSGSVRLEPTGEIRGYRAGLPFPPGSIAADDPDAALKWAWNRTGRYTGAGAFGPRRIVVVGRDGIADEWRGEHFLLAITGRADRPEDGYRYPVDLEANWAAGGEMRNRRTGSVCAFRQYQSGGRRPDYFVGTSYSRKVSREVGPDAEGPLTGCLVDATIGGGLFTHGGEPSLHHWRVREVRDVLAPINVARDTWPVEKERGYGPWGISFADDRWEQRRVIVLEGALREGQFEDGTVRFAWYLDLQTLAPLYYAAYREKGDVAGIGYFALRWSGDREDYPRWPDDRQRPVRVLDRVGAAFVDWNDQHAVRSEAGATVSIPESERGLRRKLSVGSIRLR